MTGNEYQNLAARTINSELTKTEVLLHALHGISAEDGEIHSFYQKWYQGHEIDFSELKKEVGDLLWFIAELCGVYDWKLDDVMQDNIAKLLERYPSGFEAERSLHREE